MSRPRKSFLNCWNAWYWTVWNLYDSGSWCAGKTSSNGWLESSISPPGSDLDSQSGMCRDVWSHLFLNFSIQTMPKLFKFLSPHLSFAAAFVYTLQQLWHFSRLSHFSDRRVNRKKPISNGEWTFWNEKKHSKHRQRDDDRHFGFWGIEKCCKCQSLKLKFNLKNLFRILWISLNFKNYFSFFSQGWAFSSFIEKFE